jgi:hypothetical protein
VPFLSAAAAAEPSALLADVREPYLEANEPRLPLGFGTDRALEENEWVAALSELASGGWATGPRPGSSGGSAAAAAARERREETAGATLDAVVERVSQTPVLLNLARMLAYHQRTLGEEALPAPESEELHLLVGGLSDTLRTILCL